MRTIKYKGSYIHANTKDKPTVIIAQLMLGDDLFSVRHVKSLRAAKLLITKFNKQF